MEIWKSIKDFPDYLVSSYGRVKGKSGKILKQSKKKEGYLQVTLCNISRKSALVHILVAEAFIPNPSQKPCVNHIDGDKTNNNISNLEYVTISENTLHAYKLGLCKINRPLLGKKVGKTSRYHGVSKKANGKFVGSIWLNSKTSYPKTFEKEEDAALYVNSLLDKYDTQNRPRNIING